MRSEPMLRGESPWGTIDHLKVIAPGLICVTTPGHGGYWMSPERRQEFRAVLKGVKVWNNQLPWLEEDCDWALAVLVWPALFAPEQRRAALLTVRGRSADKDAIVAFLNTKRGREFVAEVAEFETSLIGKWEVAQSTRPYPQCWYSVTLRQFGTQTQRVMAFTDWPEQQFYSEEELLAAAYQPEPASV